ncbi:MAG: hypothetical protein WBM41_01930 [Arenicellales bacterium]
MTSSNDSTFLEFGGPVTYRVAVRGKLDPDWSDRLAGMAITNTTGESGEADTVLFGQIRDQAELSGVLETLYDLHLSILRVEIVEDHG